MAAGGGGGGGEPNGGDRDRQPAASSSLPPPAATPAPVLDGSMARSGAGRPRGRPAKDGACGCGWGDALVRGSRLCRALSGRRGHTAAECGCSTAVIARVAFLFNADPKAPVSVLIRPVKLPDSSRLILEAVEPGGPWRLFMGVPEAQTMYGPYDRAGDTIQLVSETVSLLRGTGMAVTIEGDFDRAMRTFQGKGVRLPTAAELTGE